MLLTDEQRVPEFSALTISLNMIAVVESYSVTLLRTHIERQLDQTDIRILTELTKAACTVWKDACEANCD